MIVINSALPLPAISEDQEVADLLAQSNRITGTTIISDGGKQIGTIGDLFIDEQGAIVEYEVKQGLFADLRGRKFLPVSDVQAVGKGSVVAQDGQINILETWTGRFENYVNRTTRACCQHRRAR